MTAIQAARAAAIIERDLGVPVDIVDGRYGELSVRVDEEEVVTAGPLGFLGVLPTRERIRAAVEERLRSSREAEGENEAGSRRAT